jgi:trehalose 6-phosphate synthase
LARLIVVSNRVAVPTHENGSLAGGLAVAVRSLLKRHGGLWFGWSGTVSVDEDVTTRSLKHGGLSYVVTDLAEADYQEYYNGFANRVLWPILHYRLDLAEFSRRDLSGYRRANAHFATQINNLISSHPAGQNTARPWPPQSNWIFLARSVSAAGDSHSAP